MIVVPPMGRARRRLPSSAQRTQRGARGHPRSEVEPQLRIAIPASNQQAIYRTAGG